jgi:PTH1 family peptidyl-tRNA hydrolase
LDYYKIKSEDLIVIHDELDLPLGKLQIRFGGGSAGHNGIESIINSIKTDKFLRIRMGIGHPKTRIKGQELRIKSHDAITNYVVSNFEENERKEVRTMTKHVQKNIELILTHGIDSFMSKYNVKA